jgi:hypothetical protein
MGVAATRCLYQFIYNMVRRGLIRVAHTEVDNILSSGASLLLEVSDNVKNVWRQTLYTPKLIIHNYVTLLGAPAVAPWFKTGQTVLSQPPTVNATRPPRHY